MKVGIITVHFVPNYGALLQSYALSSYLREQGVDASVIDYRQPGLDEYFRFKWSLPPRLNHWQRLRRCSSFVSNDLPLTQDSYRSVQEFESAAPQYDAFITGSDQVWFTGKVQYFDPMYFLDFPAKGKRKISYAASVGGQETFGEFETRAKSALQDIDHLSVRDHHTAALVEPLAGKKPVQVLDPVFLSDFSALLTGKSPLKEPYLLVFGDFTGPRAEIVRRTAEATGLKTIVTLQYACPMATHRVPSPGPAEWLSYFRHASFVLTSYFHGTAIAVHFARPFLTYPTQGRRIKVQTLLDRFGLSERCLPSDVDGDTCAELSRATLDWSVIKSRIEPQVADSKAFLSSALS